MVLKFSNAKKEYDIFRSLVLTPETSQENYLVYIHDIITDEGEKSCILMKAYHTSLSNVPRCSEQVVFKGISGVLRGLQYIRVSL